MKIDVEKIEGTLENLRRDAGALPFPVHSWRVEAGLDWTDDPAVWIWVHLEDDEAFTRENTENRIDLADTVVDRVWNDYWNGRDVGDEYWIYVQFEGIPSGGER